MIDIQVVNGNQIVARISGLGALWAKNLRFAVAAATIDLQNYIRSEKLSGQVLHVRTGTLRRAVRAYPPISSAYPIRGDVAVDRSAPYGAMLEEGTRPHDIVPIRAEALRFMLGGNVVFAKRVHHPGTKPMPFMKPSLAEKRVEILARLRAAVAEPLK
jgi:hypothetical protein